MLSLKQLEDVCLVNAGWYGGTTPVSKQCRYLDNNWHGSNTCLKKKLSTKKKIDKLVAAHKVKCKAAGIDPQDTNVPMGDNCQGYIVLKHIEQGYDKP